MMLLNLKPTFLFDGLTLTITPKPQFKAKPKTLYLTEGERLRFAEWYAGKLMIQDAFPDWPADKRELLLTGMDDDEFHTYLGGEEE